MPRDYPKKPARFDDFRRSDNVEDRRGEGYKKPAFASSGYAEEDNEGNDTEAGGNLSAEAGYYDVRPNQRRRIQAGHFQARMEDATRLSKMSARDYAKVESYVDKRRKEKAKED